MAELDSRLRLSDPDAVFVRLVRAHEGLTAEESRRLDAALVLLLANQLGDEALLEQAIAAARAAVRPAERAS